MTTRPTRTNSEANSRSSEGLHNDAHLAAFQAAVAGKPEPLAQLLCRAAGWPGGKLNLKLAASFGVQVGLTQADVLPLLKLFADDDAATNTPRVFLPVVAAYGFGALLREGREVETAWTALSELGADGRNPIRLAVLQVLTGYCAQKDTADAFVTRATSWLDIDDREFRFGAAALALDVLGEDNVAAMVRDHAALRDYLSRVITEIADAPRAAERSETRRRALLGLPRALATAASRMPGDSGEQWLLPECERAKHPRVREALSNMIVMLRKGAQKPLADALAKALEGSAAPLRNPNHPRKGTGRGKSTRRIR